MDQASKFAAWLSVDLSNDDKTELKVNLRFVNSSDIPVHDVQLIAGIMPNLVFSLDIAEPTGDIQDVEIEELSRLLVSHMDHFESLLTPRLRRKYHIGAIASMIVRSEGYQINFTDAKNRRWVRNEKGVLHLWDGTPHGTNTPHRGLVEMFGEDCQKEGVVPIFR